MLPAETDGETSVRNGFVVGDWTVTPLRNLLARGDEHVRIEPRVMDVLVHLAERADQVVSKEELTERVWKGQYVSDDVLTVTIYALRKALGDEARRPRYIETVPRRGYRLIALPQFITTTSHLPSRAEKSRSMVPSDAGWRTIVAAVALALFVAAGWWMLTGVRRGPHVPTVEAREAYLKGRYFLDQRSIRGWREGLEQFERAVALDPTYPAAHAGLADAYSAMSDFGVAPSAELRPRAMAAARRALQLSPESAEGQAALGRAELMFDWDFAAAERSLARAVALDRDYMPAYQALAWLESARGHHAGAVAAARRARQLDPVNTARYTELAWVLALGGRYDEALGEIERALQLDPRSFETYLMKGWALELAAQPEAAFAAYRDALGAGGAPDEALARSEAVYRAEGLAGFYRTWLNRRGGSTPMSDTWRAQLYVRVGELDRAIESLEQAYRKREGALAWVNVEPTFEPLRSDVRFQQIAARVSRGE